MVKIFSQNCTCSRQPIIYKINDRQIKSDWMNNHPTQVASSICVRNRGKESETPFPTSSFFPTICENNGESTFCLDKPYIRTVGMFHYIY